MDTGAIVAIIVIAVVLIVAALLLLPKARHESTSVWGAGAGTAAGQGRPGA